MQASHQRRSISCVPVQAATHATYHGAIAHRLNSSTPHGGTWIDLVKQHSRGLRRAVPAHAQHWSHVVSPGSRAVRRVRRGQACPLPGSRASGANPSMSRCFAIGTCSRNFEAARGFFLRNSCARSRNSQPLPRTCELRKSTEQYQCFLYFPFETRTRNPMSGGDRRPSGSRH